MLRKCQCSKPGWCHIYKKDMGECILDWNWCQSATKEEREEYKEHWNKVDEIKGSIRRSLETQEIIENNKNNNIDLSKLKIAVLGHNFLQFDSIVKREYTDFIFLQDLDLGNFKDFQDNKYAEIRAYLCDGLFDYNSVEYVGVATASWNKKFTGKNNIDNIENWDSIGCLFSGRKDLVLCAELYRNTTSHDFVYYFLPDEKQANSLLSLLEKYFGYTLIKKPCPMANCIICNKEIYIGLCDFYKKFLPEFKHISKEFNYTTNNLAKNRGEAFLLEYVTMLWLDSKNLTFINNETRNSKWMDGSLLIKRNLNNYDFI